jgi:hypothetical protein
VTIDDLDLSPVARQAATLLKAAHPEVVFTSGRRDLAGQARAMASNVVHNRRWIAETYKDTEQRADLQACVDGCPAGAGQAVYGAALLDVMQDWDDAALSHVSKHLSGDAFDVQPIEGPTAAAVEATIRGLPGLTLFLDREGGLPRWHAQFA